MRDELEERRKKKQRETKTKRSGGSVDGNFEGSLVGLLVFVWLLFVGVIGTVYIVFLLARAVFT